MDVVNGYLSSAVSFTGEHAVAVACGVGALGLVAWHQSRHRRLPPGPRGWPIVGSSGLLASKPLPEVLAELRQQYGDVFCLWLGGNTYWVVFNGYDAIKEAYVDRGSDFMDRDLGYPTIWNYINYSDGLFTEGYTERHKTKRKFCAQALRTHGFNKAHLDVILPEEWQQISDALDTCTTSEGIDPERCFHRATANVIRGVLFDDRLRHDDKELDEFAEAVYNLLTSVMDADEVVTILPDFINKHVRKNDARRLKAKANTERLTSMVEKIVLDHKASFDPDNIRDFLDALLKDGSLERDGLRVTAHTCMTFMNDAITTTSSMMMFILMYLIHHPNLQERMRREINSVVGETAHRVSLAQRDDLPFTDAFISETFRIVTPITTSVPNQPLTSTTFRGYRIPKHFTTLVNIEGVHMDPSYFPEPRRFDPERFLDDNGKLKRVDQYFPFGIGRRRCMGEQLVRNELFYFTANLVQRYRVEALNGVLPDTTPLESSLARMNVPFKAVFVKL